MKRSLAWFGFRFIAAVMLLACAAGSCQLLLADDAPPNAADSGASKAKPAKTEKIVAAEKPATKKAAATAVPISPEREAAAIEFAQQNHSELVSLLQNLKQSAPKEYQAALADLDRTADRLSKLKDKSPDKYEPQLTDWKLTSRARLLAARLAMSDDPAVETELRSTLRERLELRLGVQRAERDRLQKRVEKLDQVIDEMSAKMDAQVEKQFSELHKTLPAPKTAAKKVKRPASAVSVEAKEQK